MNSLLEKKVTSENQKNRTVITTVSGKAESTEEATVFVNDLDVFVTMVLLEDALALLSLGLLCAEIGYAHEWTFGRLMGSPAVPSLGFFCAQMGCSLNGTSEVSIVD